MPIFPLQETQLAHSAFADISTRLEEHQTTGAAFNASPERLGRTAMMASVATGPIITDSASVDALMQLRDSYAQAIAVGGERQVRQQVAHEQRARQLRQFTSMSDSLSLEDPEVGAQIQEAAALRLSEEDAAREQYALEQEFVRAVRDTAIDDPYQAQLMLDNLDEGGALDVMHDRLTREMILLRAIDEAEMSMEDRSWFFGLVDFAASAIPFIESTAATDNVDTDEVTRRWYDFILSGQRLESESAALWNMPLDQFVDYVPNQLIPNLQRSTTDLGYRNQLQNLRMLQHMYNAPSALETNTWNTLDNIGVVVALGKGALSIPSAMVRAGARREAVRLVSGLADEVAQNGAETVATRYGVTVPEIEQLVLPRAVNTHGGAPGVSFAAGAAEAQERGSILLRMLTNLTSTSRLDPAELQQAVETASRSLRNRFGARVADDVQVERVALADQSEVSRVTVTVGRQDGQGFARRGNAENYATSVGLSPEDVIQDASGQWFVRATSDVSETGFFTRNLESPIANNSFGWFHRGVLSSRGLADRLLTSQGLQAGGRQNRLIRALGGTYSRVFSALPRAERNSLGEVLRLGEAEGRWFSRGELDGLYQRTFNRAPSDREIRAYQAAVDINDIEYALRNDDLYKAYQTRGYETLSFDTGRGVATEANGRVRRDGVRIGADSPRMYNVSERRHLLDVTQDQVDQMLSDGHVIVDLERAVELADGTRITRFIGRESDFNVQALRRNQLAYRPGGHRMYEGQYFVKQARIFSQPDQAGSRIYDQPGTYIVTKTRRQAEEWAATMERARQAALNDATPAEIDEIFAGRAGYPTGEEFIQHMDDGVFQRDTPFEALFDREMPSAYSPDVARRLMDEDNLPSNSGWFHTTGRMYYGGKGERLRDYTGELAPVFDPFRTINTSLSNIARLSSFSDFKHASVQRWVNTYRHALDQRGLEGMSDMAIFQNARVSDTLPNAQRIRQAAEGERDVIRRVLNWETDWDRSIRTATRAASEYAERLLGENATNIGNWLNTNRPLSAIRGFVFDLKLGLYNVAQLPLQTSTMLAAASISPKWGAQGFRAWPMVHRILLGDGRNFDGMVEQFVRNGGHTHLGMDAAEFRAYMRHARDSGIYDVSGTHIMVNDYGPTAAFGQFGQRVQDFREAGRFFFYQAEVMNRIVARHIAWKRVREQLPNVAVDSPEFVSRVAGLTDDFSLNMMRESRARWQDGLLSIPTQFWAYNARMLELMLGNRLTGMERFRLAAGQFLLYGTAGVPLLPVAADMVRGDNPPDMNTPLGLIDRGFLDHLIYNLPLIGADVRAGERVGTGQWSAELVREIFGASEYGDESLADMLGGASYQIVTGVMDDLFNYVKAEFGVGESTVPRDQAIRSLASEVSTLSNAWKAYLVFRYGTYTTGTGTTLVSDLPPHHAFYTLLSYQPGEAGEIGDFLDFFNNRSERVSEASRVIQNYRTRMINRPNEREEIRAEMLEFARMLPPDIRQDALRRANRDMSPSLYQGLADQIERERLEINAARENEQPER